LASTQSLLSSSTSSCSYKHQKQTQFLSSFSKILFLDFILGNDEINMMWKGVNKKMVDERGRDKKSNMQMVKEGQKMK
jgi:hypothetical protein